MRTAQNFVLPALQIAAALFSASGAHAAAAAADDEAEAETYCVDAGDLIVDAAQCDGTAAPGTFFFLDGAPGGAAGAKVAGAVGSKTDSADAAALTTHGFTSGGFGRRDDENQEGNAAAALALAGAAS